MYLRAIFSFDEHFPFPHRHTGDTGYQPEDFYEPRHRYSLSDMITHIKRSIPDLRAVKHQPLENKESPCGSPKHHGDNGAGTSGMIGGKCSTFRNQTNFGSDGIGYDDKETDAVTLSAVQTTSCTCGPAKGATTDNVTQIDKTRYDLEEDDAALSTNSHHHHYHYHPYQHSHRQQNTHEAGYESNRVFFLIFIYIFE